MKAESVFVKVKKTKTAYLEGKELYSRNYKKLFEVRVLDESGWNLSSVWRSGRQKIILATPWDCDFLISKGELRRCPGKQMMS